MGSTQTDRLEALLQSSRASNEPEIKAALSKLAAEIKERADRGSPGSRDFFMSAIRSLARIQGLTHAELRMSCLFDSLIYLYSNKFDAEALQAAKQFSVLATATGNKDWIRRSKLADGIVYAHTGSITEAVLSYAASIALARELCNPAAEASALANLGNAMNYAGLYSEAVPILRYAVTVSGRSEAAAPYAATALCNVAQSFFFLGDHRTALDSIEKSIRLSGEPTTAFASLARTVREFTYVQIAVELGKLHSAREHSAACSRYALQSGTGRCENLAMVARGLCEIHGGDVEVGLQLLERALTVSGEEGTPQYISSLGALVRGYYHAGQPERALPLINLYLDNMKRAREQTILSLVSIPQPDDSPILFASEQSDLKELHIRRAELRAQVAEREVVSSRIELLERMAVTADLKEECSGEHGYRVGRLTGLMCRSLGMSNDTCGAAEAAGRLHDLGKLSVPDRILLSTMELGDAERHFICAHTTIGAELLAKSNIPQLRLAEEIARYHHEWWNGEGYPSKLAGKRIPIHARIVALADVFDALTHGRPFSKPWPMDRAIAEIRNRKGTQFDPELTDVFLALIERLRSEHEDLDEYLGRAGRNSPFLQAREKIRRLLSEEREHEQKATVEGNETRH